MKTFFDFGGGLIGVIKQIKLSFVGDRIIFFTTAWVSQIFSMTDSRPRGLI